MSVALDTPRPRVRVRFCATVCGSIAGALCLFATGCFGIKWRACERAWDDLRCDRRIAVFVNLRLDTIGPSRAAQGLSADSQGSSARASTSASVFNSALVYLHSRKVSEVVFDGRTTAHGALGEFRALNGGFSSIPDPAYRRGHATVTWAVKRTYRFAPDDARGKYHPSTFWSGIFGSPWTDGYISSGRVASAPSPSGQQPSAIHPDSLPLLSSSSAPRLFVLNYYGSRCHIEEIAQVVQTDDKSNVQSAKKTWSVIRAWDETMAEP